MNARPLFDLEWTLEHLDDIGELIVQHLQLTAIPVAAGFLIAFVLGVAAARRPILIGPVTVFAGLLYTIPSLAAFAILIPITGLSLLTAVIPLTAYTLLILIRNIVAGFAAVPGDVIEAAEGMGYTSRQRLWRIELPLAVPLMMAGVRLAVVTTIGLATVAAIIGDDFGGLGQFITEGLQTSFPTKIYLGAGLSVMLAFAADFLFVRAERAITPWARARAALP